LGKEARALHPYEILKVRQPICTFTEADIFVILQYGIGHSTRHRNFPATCDVIIGDNTLCKKRIRDISHFIIKIDITLTALCFQVKTLRFSLYSAQGCILLFKLLALHYFVKVKFTLSSRAHARACANVNPASFMLPNANLRQNSWRRGFSKRGPCTTTGMPTIGHQYAEIIKKLKYKKA